MENNVNPQRLAGARKIIARAEKSLGVLTDGQRRDLLADNSMWDLAEIASLVEVLQADRPTTVITISLFADRTQVHTRDTTGGEPRATLQRAMQALQSELDAVDNCPHHGG